MSLDITGGSGPHAGQKIWSAGAPASTARGAMILLHGRGATADDILSLSEHFGGKDIAYLAPQATGYAWYPQRFLQPRATNEPWLSSALSVVQAMIDELIAAGIPEDRIVLLGFSQGACLALESGARHPRPYAGLIGLSGGLIGADAELWDGSDDFTDIPVFLGCSERDPHIPLDRVNASAERFVKAGAKVTRRVYAGSSHTITGDEVEYVSELVAGLDAAGYERLG